jgi:predicted nucleic acid-binding protein
MKKDKLSLDANILFSAAYREHAGLLRLWELKSVTLISSLYAIEEARRNLDLPQQKERLETLLTHVEKISFHENARLPEGVTIKEKDRPILLAAIFSNADYLLTGDVRDFGKFYRKKIEGLTVLPPSDYLNKV